VLQCVSVCCSVLQCVAVCCSESCALCKQSYTVCCSVLQCVAVWCSVLQCGALCCSVLQCGVASCSTVRRGLAGITEITRDLKKSERPSYIKRDLQNESYWTNMTRVVYFHVGALSEGGSWVLRKSKETGQNQKRPIRIKSDQTNDSD